jgi:hypothetical protein
MAHMHMLDYMQAEPESEVKEEQLPEVFEGPQAPNFVDTNIFPEQDKPWCIPPQSLTFILNHYFMVSLIVHYVYRN